MQRWHVGLVLSTAVIAAAAVVGSLTVPDGSTGCQLHGHGLYATPDRGCTPGEWIDSDGKGVCGSRYNPRPSASVTAPIKRASLKRYGLPLTDTSAYELDHLYPRWLGGSTTAANLWPELNYRTSPSNPKDRLELVLYQAVCQRHSISVSVARQAFAGAWTTAYRKYVTNPR